ARPDLPRRVGQRLSRRIEHHRRQRVLPARQARAWRPSAPDPDGAGCRVHVARACLTRVDVQTALELVLVTASAVGLATRVMAATRRDVRRRISTFNDLVGRVDNLLQAQRQLLADTSHELRTPLTTIRGNLDLLERELPPAERAEVLAETREEVDRMARLVR